MMIKSKSVPSGLCDSSSATSKSMKKSVSVQSLQDVVTSFQILSVSGTPISEACPCIANKHSQSFETLPFPKDDLLTFGSCLATPAEPELFIAPKPIVLEERHINILLRRRKINKESISK